jgi:hypothetical protein
MRTPIRFALLLAAAPLPSVLHAQGVTVQSIADVRLMGALGAAADIAARMGGGSMHDIATTTYVSGHRMRSESSVTGSIIDADAGRTTSIDHKAKTYVSMTFAEMAAAMQQGMQDAKKSAAKDKAKDPKATDDEMKVNYKVAVDRTGERAKIAGFDAERVFVTITMEGEVQSEGKKDEQVGSLIFLMDQWLSKDAPQIAAMTEFQRAYAQKAGQEFRANIQGMQAAMAADPRMKDGFAAAQKELAKINGIALRSTTHIVLLPVGLAFDRKLAMGDATAAAAAKKDEKPKGGGLRGMMGAIKAAADDANKQEQANKNAPPKQSTMMMITDEVKSITRGAVAEEMFAPPAGYREVKRPSR